MDDERDMSYRLQTRIIGSWEDPCGTFNAWKNESVKNVPGQLCSMALIIHQLRLWKLFLSTPFIWLKRWNRHRSYIRLDTWRSIQASFQWFNHVCHRAPLPLSSVILLRRRKQRMTLLQRWAAEKVAGHLFSLPPDRRKIHFHSHIVNHVLLGPFEASMSGGSGAPFWLSWSSVNGKKTSQKYGCFNEIEARRKTDSSQMLLYSLETLINWRVWLVCDEISCQCCSFRYKNTIFWGTSQCFSKFVKACSNWWQFEHALILTSFLN